VVFSIFTLFSQLIVLFSCCSGVGLFLRLLLPKDFSLLHKVLFSLIGGFFLVVLIPQNLIYVGVPIRISAWFLFGGALVQGWLCRDRLVAWIRTFYSNTDIQTLAVVIVLTVAFHGIAPIRQGLEWYYGKGYDDQLNDVLLAEFLKEEPYGTSGQETGLRPWLTRPVGFQHAAEELETSPEHRPEALGLKNERLGQSIVMAEISVWSGTDGKGGYAATVIFVLTLLAICLYVFLREVGLDQFMAALGALLAALLPAVTRLSLNGFLSQLAILFVFPFFVSLLRREELSARSFTLFFSLALAYLVAAYSEIAPVGLCILFLGVVFVRRDKFRTKRLMFMSAILITALLNPLYLTNFVHFLVQQTHLAANPALLDSLAPKILTLRGWSELLFGVATNSQFALFFDYCTLLVTLLFLAGIILLARRDRLILGVILLPVLVVVLYLIVRTPFSYYPIARIALTILPFVIGLVFIPLSKWTANGSNRSIDLPKKALAALIAFAAVAGSVRYYSEVLNNGGVLRYIRDARFLNVCRELQEMKHQRVLVFETNPSLTQWLCYHARHNDVYFDGRFINDSSFPQLAPYSTVSELANIDFVVTRDRIVDLKAPSVSCLTLVDDVSGETRTAGHDRYWLGHPARVRFLAFRAISANLKMRLAPAPLTTVFPIDYFLSDREGHVSQGALWDENVDVRRMTFPQGLSVLQLSVKAKLSNPNAEPSFPVLAVLDNVEISDIELNPGG
jgi:hypothetical protein